ncbi:MAG: DNA repair protein RecN [Bacilli bacterium]|nr:DNA repair protein RecN [Bacilli bacterium]
MLKRLSVKNFAIIEDIDISFNDGLTVLTGETGAGKSLVIDSISLLLGERANLEMIRHGEDKAIITGVFSFKNIYLEALLNSLNIDYSDNTITITRIISSRGVVKVNDTIISLNDLKLIAHYLADIHLQFDMTKLLNRENYLDIVDGFKNDVVNEYKSKYQESLIILKKQYSYYQELVKKSEEIKKNREFYEYDLKELQGLDLKENEDEEIKEQISYLKNYDRIYSLLAEIKETSDKESLEDIYHIKDLVKSLSEYQSEYQEYLSRIESSYYELEDIYDSLRKKFKNLDYNPSLLDELETRLNEISLIEKKHHKNISELIAYQKELEQLISLSGDDEILLKEEHEKLEKLYNTTYQYALDLSKVRDNIGKNIAKEIERHLSDLSLKARFEVLVSPNAKKEDLDLSIFFDNGVDVIDFYIETNIGEGMKPLNKVVSGGEASRIMLALKALYIKSNKIETVIFDEIDTGISGEVASKVAHKIYEISLSTQVISITHLPQVASLSKNHIKISKSVNKGRTYTSIKELSLEEKIYEIALMISEGKVTESQLSYAKEMVINKK